MGKPHLYPIIPSIDKETQIYTQRRKNSETPTNYRFTLEEVMIFLKEEGFVRTITGTYRNDSLAIAGGGSIGDYYNLAINNEYNIPVGNGGLLKRIES